MRNYDNRQQHQPRGGNNSLLQQFATQAYRKDSVDHVRVHREAVKFIGQAASEDWRRTFFIPHLGEFGSAQCFAKWLGTGNEDARHNHRFRVTDTIAGYRNFLLYGKYYQLCSMRNWLLEDKDMMDLPFAAYHIHTSGIKEFNRWREYASAVKLMLKHILDPNLGPKKPFPWDEHFPGLKDSVEEQIAKIVELSGGAPEQLEDELDESNDQEQAVPDSYTPEQESCTDAINTGYEVDTVDSEENVNRVTATADNSTTD